MMNYSSRAIGTAVLMLAASAATATTPTGSGSVNFEFLSFSGPVQVTFPPFVPGESPQSVGSLINGVTPTLDGRSIPTRPGGSVTWEFGGTTFAPGTNRVEFGEIYWQPTDPQYNVISFAGATFANVSPGTEFRLGTITFQNGNWSGGGATPLLNRTSLLPFRIWTTSSDGPQFNQEQFGIITLTVNATGFPANQDPANFDAEADWITVFMGDDPTDSSSWIEVADFRVYDLCCKPAGLSSTGTVDLMGKFGSLILTDLANPVGGFIVGNNNALPVVPGGGGGVTPGVIPEPATWAMMIAGFGLVGGVMRRRRDALTA